MSITRQFSMHITFCRIQFTNKTPSISVFIFKHSHDSPKVTRALQVPGFNECVPVQCAFCLRTNAFTPNSAGDYECVVCHELTHIDHCDSKISFHVGVTALHSCLSLREHAGPAPKNSSAHIRLSVSFFFRCRRVAA